MTNIYTHFSAAISKRNQIAKYQKKKKKRKKEREKKNEKQTKQTPKQSKIKNWTKSK